MAARWMAAGVWAAVAASTVFWGLRLTAHGPGVPAHARWIDTEQVARGDVSRLFASPTASGQNVATAPSRFRLLGVMAPALGGAEGVALLAVDDKPARAYRLGAVVDGDAVVKSVSARRVELGPRHGVATAVLELPVPAPAARGVPGGGGGGPVPVAPVDPLPGAVGGMVPSSPPPMSVSPVAVPPVPGGGQEEAGTAGREH